VRTDLLVELIRRRAVERYVGTSSRTVWVFISPIVPLAVNIAVFYFIARIPQIQSMGLAIYAAFLFSGLLPFRILQRATTESSDLLITNMEMLKTAVFPLPFLSISVVGTLIIEFLIQCVFLFVLLAIAKVSLSWTIVLLPVAVIALLITGLGLSWLLSLLGYALRDVQEILAVLFPALAYVTPIMYPVDAAPSFLKTIIYLNPLSSYVIIFRDAILPGAGGIHWMAWAVSGSISVIFAGAGFLAIRSAQRYVGDMI
jgi:lipopolysaccharide transport system permease protein